MICIILESGKVFGVGQNDCGQLGLETNVVDKPKHIESLIDIKQIQCGNTFSGVLTNNGIIQTFGNGNGGVLGIPKYGNIYKPTTIESLNNITSINCGVHSMGGINMNKECYIWGNIIGIKKKSSPWKPKLIKIQQNIEQLSLGYDHTLILTNNNTVYGFGSNKYSQLSSNNKLMIELDEPYFEINKKDYNIFPNTRIISVVAGYQYSNIITM